MCKPENASTQTTDNSGAGRAQEWSYEQMIELCLTRIVIGLLSVAGVGWLVVAFCAFEVIACQSGWSSCI
jgi:hypothetical protein